MRVEDWPEKLAEVIARHAALPFQWGVSDCFILPMDVCAALTGAPDPYADEREYADAQAAARRLHNRGFKTIEDAFVAAFEECPPVFARRGDIGIADYPGAILGGGVVVLGLDVIGKGEQGTVRLPRDRLKRAFKVG